MASRLPSAWYDHELLPIPSVSTGFLPPVRSQHGVCGRAAHHEVERLVANNAYLEVTTGLSSAKSKEDDRQADKLALA